MNGKGDLPGLFAAKRLSDHNRAEMREIFERAIKLAERGQLRMRVPLEVKHVQKLRGMHYHYRPELFLQLQGRTDFQFPKDAFSLSPDELCVIPAGVPHGEIVHAEAAQPFRNLVAGFYNKTSTQVDAFLKLRSGRFITLAHPGATMTQAFGVNDSDEVVGTYTDGTGSSAKTFGFTWTSWGGWKTISDPLGVGATTINGVNDAGDLVGFYTDSAGNTDGLLWAASRHTAPSAPRVTQSVTVTVKPAVTPTTPTTSVTTPTSDSTAAPSHW